MDPASHGDPLVLLVELIELLRRIKDSGDVGHATAAIGAVQYIAARSKPGADSIFPSVPILSSSSLHDPVDLVDVMSAVDGPSLRANILLPVPDALAARVAEPLTSVETDAVPPPALSTLPCSDLAPRPVAHAPVPPKADVQPLLQDSSPAVQSPCIPSSPLVKDIPKATVPPPAQATRAAPAPTQPSVQSQTPRAAQGSKPGGSPQPEAASSKPRNLIVCIDGTSNQFSQKNTNVVELYHRLIKDDEQLTFYNSGIGTYATPSWKSLKYLMQVLKNKIDLAIAWNLESILLSAYLWLCENYRQGDRIYLFGFSRGAYQVRALSAMIESVGLLYKGNQDQIPFAFQLYAETKHFHRVNAMRRRFKETFSWTVTVELVAVWDTVSSVGIFRDKMLPGTTDGMKHVKYFRHALALHERRIKFLPENAREGAGPLKEQTQARDGARPHTKEVWFAGSHSNIGGGAMPNEDLNTFGPALRWMTFEATLAGVRLKDAPQKWKDIAISNSLTTGWKLFEALPFARLRYRGERTLTHRLHLGRPRKIQEHQLIHETAFDQWIRELLDNSSRWRAQLPAPLRWDKDALQALGLVEADPYTAANRYLETMAKPDFSGLSNDDIIGLKTLISTYIGRRSLRDIPTAAAILSQAIYRILTYEGTTTLEDVHTTLGVLENVIARCGFICAGSPMPQARAHAVRIALEDEPLARRIMEFCHSAMVVEPLEHPNDVNCVAYLPDGDHIVSGCDDGAVRVWNLETRQIVGVPMTGHAAVVFCVAVSTDGAKIASGSADKTIRVWNVKSAATIALLEGHSDCVRSVAFSPDGKRVVSGSEDGTIRFWDVASAKPVVGPIQRHSNGVSSIAHSPDGSRISGADDTVRVWNSETGEELWQAGMSFLVYSVAYSPDGARIVAGCMDRTVHVLDAETGDLVLGPLTGSADSAISVAFSADGRKIASGSADGTIRLWDAETGSQLDVLRGHRHVVYSVSLSPDGKHVASASADNTVRIWDATGQRMRW